MMQCGVQFVPLDKRRSRAGANTKLYTAPLVFSIIVSGCMAEVMWVLRNQLYQEFYKLLRFEKSAGSECCFGFNMVRSGSDNMDGRMCTQVR